SIYGSYRWSTLTGSLRFRREIEMMLHPWIIMGQAARTAPRDSAPLPRRRGPSWWMFASENTLPPQRGRVSVWVGFPSLVLALACAGAGRPREICAGGLIPQVGVC